MIRIHGLYPRLLALPRGMRVLACLAVFAVIAFASSLSGGSNGGAPDTRAFVLNWGHQWIFGALAVSLALAAGVRLPARPILGFGLLLLVATVGIADEIHQASNPARDSSVWDLVSDILGAGIALAIAGWTARHDPPTLRMGPLLFCAGLSAAWNCVPAFAPNLPLHVLLP